jgi:membrane-anchored protein YejM (alkaline phosphatase superfamily)
MPFDPRRAVPPGAGLRFPAFLWALLHVPLILFLYAPSLGPALRGVPAGYRAPLWPALGAEALVLALAMFVLPLPLSLAGRPYRLAAPFFAGLGTVLLAVDAQLYASVGFHVNGFFFQVLKQPSALRETGIPTREVVQLALEGAGWVILETLLGAWFLRRLASPRRVWPALLAIVLLGAAERVYVASLTFFGGQAVFAAGQVLPLQIPVRMNAFWAARTGRPALGNPLRAASADTAIRIPPGVDPASIALTRRPDVLLLLMESARQDYLVPEVMPRLARRAAARGMVFEDHYTTAPSTFFAVYGLLFGLHSYTLDAVLGTGRKPLFFGALAANGYLSKIFAASSVDWMGLRETVFGDVQNELETDWPEDMPSDQRDAAIIEHAKRAVRATPPDRPLFLFLFFDGTHFNYAYPPRAAIFQPAWDGQGVLKATRAPPETILNRGKNSAYELDWKMDEFLDWMEQARGRAPLAIVTGDHGEEMREKGHIGHGSALVREQVAVPMVIVGDGVPVGRHRGATFHPDVLPTLLWLLGDRTPPPLYSDGRVMFDAPGDRFVLVSMGWEPRYAAVSRDLKVAFNAMDAGLGGVSVTDTWDRPLADGDARFHQALPRIVQLFARAPASPPARAR